MSYSINKKVAVQLKKARSNKGWSLDVASQHCGVSKAMLGQIERGESSPTIAKLWNIATGFELPLSEFLDLDEKFHIKGSEDAQLSNIKTVFEYDRHTKLEMFELYFAVGYEQRSDAHQSGVIEHIIVTKGCLEYFADQQWTTLHSGDKAKFKADQTHIYRNVGTTPLHFFNIIYYP
ncbi:XRE family transcriptional regulator [Psychromonas aquatilis]|uniref:XRE family transcriptional regulator n=1 Tax=Psychromonas aquatilis TaxID=2005072 RepID=A0ABU9GPA6_9GAMM